MPELRIDGIIGDVFNTAIDVREQVEAMNIPAGGQLDVIINSPGGNVFEGFAIYNYLRALPFKVTTDSESMAASISSLILLAADKDDSAISEVAAFMIHRAIAPSFGNKEDLEKQAEILGQIDETLISVYAERTGLARDTLEEMLSKETWLTGKEAFEMGFVGNQSNPIPAQAVANAHINKDNSKIMGLTSLLKRMTNSVEDVVIDSPEAVTTETTTVENVEAKTEGEDTPEYVTKSQLDEVVNSLKSTNEGIDKLADAFGSFMDKASAESKAQNETNTNVETKVENVVKNIVAGLPSSKGQPIEGETVQNAWVDPYAKHREEQKARDKRTRPSNQIK